MTGGKVGRRRPARLITIRSVDGPAGVSESLVSLVVRGASRVSEERRKAAARSKRDLLI